MCKITQNANSNTISKHILKPSSHIIPEANLKRDFEPDFQIGSNAVSHTISEIDVKREFKHENEAKYEANNEAFQTALII